MKSSAGKPGSDPCLRTEHFDIGFLSDGWAMLVAALMATLPIGRRGLAIAGVVSVRAHLMPGQEAGRQRDAVLAAAMKTLSAQACRPIAFAALPDSSGGAYVFRNGFPEALALSGAPPQSAIVSRGGEACPVAWDGAAFR